MSLGETEVIEQAYDIVRTGIVPDGGGISFGNGTLKVDVDKVPGAFREMEKRFGSTDKPDDIVLAFGYRDMAGVVEAVARGDRPSFLQPPYYGFVNRLVDSFPVSPDSVCTFVLYKTYVECAARLTYGKFK